MQYGRARLLIYILFILLCLGVSASTFLSWSETMYFNMHPLLLPIFFTLSLLLFVTIVKDDLPFSTGVKLTLIIIYSFLANMIHIALLYPGLTGDLTYHLAVERTWDKFGTHYMLLWPLDTYASQISGFFNRLYIFQRGTAQYGLTVALSKMLNVDLFWVHTLLIGSLWSVFVPITAFKISKTLKANDRASLLTGVLIANLPILILWSWKQAGNVFGFFFFFIAIYFVLKSFSSHGSRKYIFLALLTSAVSTLSHPMTGIVSFLLIPLALSAKNYYSERHSSFSFGLPTLAFSLITITLSLPAASVLLELVYPTHSLFSLTKIVNFDAYQLIFAQYTDYTFVAALTYEVTTILAIVGMGIFKPSEKEKAPRLFLILTFSALLLQYRVFYYFIENPLFGLHRLLALQPFIIIPFAAIAIDRFLGTRESSNPREKVHNPPSKTERRFRGYNLNTKVLATALICIGLAGLLIQGHVLSFKADALDRQPFGIISPYSIEAVNFIHEEYLRDHQRYVVVSDMVTENAGLSLLGRSNVEELYLETPMNPRIYVATLKQRSREPLLEAATVNNPMIVYLVAARYTAKMYIGPSANFDEIIDSFSKSLERIAVFGEGERQVYVFRLRASQEPFTGIGPNITAFKDSQEQQVNSTYSYVYLDEVEYSVALTGATNYTITNWPQHWSYDSISRSPSSIIVDADKSIQFTGVPMETYMVKWIANELFPNVIWKDDSFLEGWTFAGRYTLSSYSFTTSGDIVKDSLSGQANDYATYQKSLPSLTDGATLLMRVKGDVNSRFIVQIWDDISKGWEGRAFTSGWIQPSPDYTTQLYTLPSNATLNLLWLSVMTTDGNPTNVYVDYIMVTR